MTLVQQSFPVRNYDLAATLTSGQAFRWQQVAEGWEGVIGSRWVRLKQLDDFRISAESAAPVRDWRWLTDYLQLDIPIEDVIATFPKDPAMQQAIESCRGLRLLRQERWECLASFICSSTKQIVQIQQIVAALCSRFGEPVKVPAGHAPEFSFPSAQRLARCSESELRECKLGFRAPYLLATSQLVASGEINLHKLATMPVDEARQQLLELPGVGRKIADCVLLFGYGFQQAFPIDVWVLKALRQLYFRGRNAPMKRLLKFSQKHFGPHAGYAQQYLFHYMRVKLKLKR